jgi:hypothetical protein
MTILEQVVNDLAKSPSVRIALTAFIEGRGLDGDWRLQITGAELVPAESEPDGS